MLTGDLKVIDVEWVVQYRVSNPDKFLHQVRNPEQTLRDVSESVVPHRRQQPWQRCPH